MAKKLPPEVQAIISASDAGYHATTVTLVKKYVQQNPDSQRAWLDLGHALGHLCRYDEAQAAFEKAVQLATDDDPCNVIFGELGNLARSKGDFDSAATWYQKQIDVAPTDSTGPLFLGNLELRRGNVEAAIETLERGVQYQQICPEEFHFALGCAYRSKDEFMKAKQHFEQAIAADGKYEAAKVALKDVKAAISAE